MKEKNAFESSPGGASASEPNNEESMEIDDDEDFDLETPNRTQSLGMNFYLLYHTQRARKFKKVQAKKKLVKSNKSISRKIFLIKFHFLQFQKWPKISF